MIRNSVSIVEAKKQKISEIAKHPRQLILHLNRGSQYSSDDYQKLLKSHGLICSMSKRRDCYDNAAMGNWNHHFKIEAIHGEKFATCALAKIHVFECIEIYYNRKDFI